MNGASTEFTGREGMSEAPSNWRVHIVYNFSGFKVEVKSSVNRTNLDTSPKGSECHPRVSLFVYDDVRVDALKLSWECDTITAPVSVHGSSDAGLKVLR